MVPGYFDVEFAASLGAFFLVGFMIALLAGRKYRSYDDPPQPGFKAAPLSLPVVLYTATTVLISVAGYLNYTPRPKGH